jgi:hypothetical protein
VKGIITQLVLLSTVVAVAAAQPVVNICGRVTDENGNPLKNTLIRLCQTRYDSGYGPAPYYTTTNGGGYYHIGTANCVVSVLPSAKTIKGNAFAQPSFAGEKVVFSLPEDNSLVNLSFYSLSGRLIRSDLTGRYAKGNYSVSINMRGLATQQYLLCVTINGASTVLKARPNAFGPAGGTQMQSSPLTETHLEKLEAVVDTLRATEPGYALGVAPIQAITGSYNFTLKKVSTWDGNIEGFWDTTKVKKEKGKLWYTVVNRTHGQIPDSLIWLANGDGGVPWRLSDKSTIDYTNNASGRLYIMVGYNPLVTKALPNGSYRPDNQVWDFEEHTNGIAGDGTPWYHGNTTRVDNWSTPITYRIRSYNGFDTTRGDQYVLFFQPRQTVFDEFVNEVPYEFTKLGTMRAPWKIPNPGTNGSDVGPNGKYVSYSDKYAAKFGVGQHAYLDGIQEPKTSAGMHRHVMGLTDAQQNDAAFFYKAAPCNFYSYFLHRRAIDNKCYGFPYDDYANWSSYIEHGSISWVEVAIGY